MHDVGKLAIPLALLRKPGPLTAQERRTIESHSTHGERIVATVTGQATVAAIVRSVHERWDGAGYPDGLAGTEIPHAGRVIFACDTYDAITSERPYRVAGAPAEAVQELRRGAGAQFDPGVVDAVIRCLGALGEAPAVERGYPRAARSASSILS
jgi:HD-GYP domain-containing protein (c-di-GMP phosphodiesterase class II)